MTQRVNTSKQTMTDRTQATNQSKAMNQLLNPQQGEHSVKQDPQQVTDSIKYEKRHSG